MLVLRQRPGFLDANQVANTGDLVLIVHLHLGVGADGLTIQCVLFPVFQLHNDGFLHLVRHHITGANLAGALGLLVHVCLTHN